MSRHGLVDAVVRLQRLEVLVLILKGGNCRCRRLLRHGGNALCDVSDGGDGGGLFLLGDHSSLRGGAAAAAVAVILPPGLRLGGLLLLAGGRLVPRGLHVGLAHLLDDLLLDDGGRGCLNGLLGCRQRHCNGGYGGILDGLFGGRQGHGSDDLLGLLDLGLDSGGGDLGVVLLPPVNSLLLLVNLEHGSAYL